MRAVLVIFRPEAGLGCGSWIGIGLLMVVLAIGAVAFEVVSQLHRAVFYPPADVSILAYGSGPQWLSDSEVFFHRLRKDTDEIEAYVIKAIDGSQLREVPNTARYTAGISYLGCNGEAFTDNGLKKAYCVRKRNEIPDEIWISDSSGGNARFLAYRSCQRLKWSPNQKNLLCWGYAESYAEYRRDEEYHDDGIISIIWNAGSR